MLCKRFKKYIEVFMWCVLIFGVAFPSLRLQQMTIERSETQVRRMSYISNANYISKFPIASKNNDIAVSDGNDDVVATKQLIHRNSSTIGNDIRFTDGEHNRQIKLNHEDDTLNDWPLIDTFVEGSKIIGDVKPLLDFAIIAHPKTATSNMQNWFRLHPEIQMHEFENHALAKGKPAELVSNLYELRPGWKYKRGYKAPRDLIIAESLLAIATYWPTTKLIVGLRHPVLWFESFYNFRVHNGYNMPPPETLIGKLKRGMVGVATDESKFHLHLDNLGKTTHSQDEIKLLSWGNESKLHLPKMRNPIFLYEIDQLRDANETTAAIFASDLKNFLGLKRDFKPISTKKGPHYKKAIEICEPTHKVVRKELMKNAKEASTWIRTYFLPSPDVTVSSPSAFDTLLKSWMVDPCDTWREKQ